MTNKLLELPIEDFGKLLSVIGKEKDYEFRLDFYTDLISIGKGLGVDEIEELPIEKHKELSKELMEEIVDINQYNKLPNEIRIGSTLYYTSAKKENFSFKTKEFKMIQAILGKPEYVVDFAAIIWREKDGELTQEAIDTRKAIFSNGLKVKHIISYINLFTNHLISDDNS